jgi:XTP/dITP diphosphohydrolase
MTIQAQKIVIASGNQGKIKEFQAMLSNYTVVSQGDFKFQDVEETGSTFVENALLKARHATSKTHLPAIADDSGLVVDALNGKPGVMSARYAGEKATDKANLLKLIAAVRGLPDKKISARFICVLVFMRSENDPCPLISQGVWEGRIVTKPKGTNGFGYDPIFFVEDYQCTSAQLTPEQKNNLSHRGKALRRLKKQMGA